MANEWEQQFKQMRAQFFQRACQRLDNSAVLLAAARQDDGELARQALEQLRKDFHWLAGTGGTYKLPEVTEIGSTCEELLEQLMTQPGSARDGSMERLDELLQRARGLMSSEDS